MRSAHNSLDAAVPHQAWALQAPAILLAAYLLVHFALRLLMAPTLGIDDAEQTLFAQHWAWGYRFRQPPLFTWLLLPVSEVTGPGILAVSLVRYALIGLYVLFFHLTALRWIGDRQLAALATGGNLLIYVFAYYAHHDLTHTTMLATMIAMTSMPQKTDLLARASCKALEPGCAAGDVALSSLISSESSDRERSSSYQSAD